MPQIPLDRGELRRLSIRNQYGDHGLTVIEWMALKGAASEYGVTDWEAVADPTLTYGENRELMRLASTKPCAGGPTMRELGHLA